MFNPTFLDVVAHYDWRIAIQSFVALAAGAAVGYWLRHLATRHLDDLDGE